MISAGWGIVPFLFLSVALLTTYTSDDYDKNLCENRYPLNPEQCFINLNEQDERNRPYIIISLIITLAFMITAYISNNMFKEKITKRTPI